MSAADRFRLESFLPYLVHRVGSRLAEAFAAQFAEAGLTLQEWRALAVLYEYGPQTMGEIARHTSINASTMTRLVGQMETRDLVRRERPLGNQRTVYVRLLEAGRDRVEFLIPRVIAYEAEVSACFSPAELRTLKSLLVRFHRSVSGEDAEGDGDRLAG